MGGFDVPSVSHMLRTALNAERLQHRVTAVFPYPMQLAEDCNGMSHPTMGPLTGVEVNVQPTLPVRCHELEPMISLHAIFPRNRLVA